MKSGVYFDCYYPSFCANCGKEVNVKDDLNDYKAKSTYTCECGTKFVRIVEEEDLSEETLKELNHYR